MAAKLGSCAQKTERKPRFFRYLHDEATGRSHLGKPVGADDLTAVLVVVMTVVVVAVVVGRDGSLWVVVAMAIVTATCVLINTRVVVALCRTRL